MSSSKHHEYCRTATLAGLHYVTDGLAGISRRRSGTGWSYKDEAGARIGDPVARRRFNDLVIPPAWKDVWICPDPDGHIQVTARDALGRKQYRYHPLYRTARDASKFRHMLEFSEVLPALRERVERDLRASPQSRRQLLATVVWLLDKTLIRVGNDEYAKENHSYGLTTMLKKHAKVTGAMLSFSFRGKSGVEHVVAVDDPRLARIVQRSRDTHGQEIFQYLDADGQRKPILSDDVNDYLREVSGRDITAKDFRTWGGTMVAALALRTMGAAASPTEAEHNIVQALEAVAVRLGNTRAVCRKYYVHPALLIAYQLGLTAPPSRAEPNKRRATSRAALRHDEQLVLQFLLESAAA
ncbi:MAG: DNA topoisomerase IB [Gallionellaceae bacterium]|nr:DNA topoisomerase IB [Gallionellaceae bacterium]